MSTICAPDAKKQKTDNQDTQILTLNFPFPNEKYADLAFNVLIADKDPKNSQVKRSILVDQLDKNKLVVHFESKNLKSIGLGFWFFC